MNYDKALGIAISNCLSDWNNELTNLELLNAVFEEDWDNVTVWEPFEHYDGRDVASHISSLAKSIFDGSR